MELNDTTPFLLFLLMRSPVINHFEILSRYPEVTHFVSTRIGGESSFPYESLNLGINQGDLIENVLANRNGLASAEGISIDSFVFARQTHSRNVHKVTEADRGRGALSRASAIDSTDGMITNVPGICLVTLAADCVPILYFDPVNKAIGVAHAGWKGTVIETPEAVVSAMVTEYGSDPGNLIVAIGPSAGPCCYEVGDNVISEVQKHFRENLQVLVSTEKEGKMKFDLWEANRITLRKCGVKPHNIELACVCTICRNDLYFSARKGDLGRFGAGIMVKPLD